MERMGRALKHDRRGDVSWLLLCTASSGTSPGPVLAVTALTTRRPPPAALVGDRPRELRRAGIAAVKLLVRRRGGFHGWLQTKLLARHALTRCGCGLIHCR
jgi:hypothetical protein